jgi:hypothetical protein
MDRRDAQVTQELLASDEPSIRYRVRAEVLGENATGPDLADLQHKIRRSARVQALLSGRDASGRVPWPPYTKWVGAHWVLVDLAALAYPPGDRELIPLREQVLDWWLGARHQERIVNIAGKTRRCASQEGNALWALLRLGLADERCEALARRLLAWQWPDGGWNCDRNPQARSSSFMETLIPMRALSLFGSQTGCGWATEAAGRASGVFLERRLFRRRRDGSIISPDFVKLHYPCYWHYDILFGLKVLAEMGLVGDARCREALGVLVSKRLPSGGWPAEAKYWRLPVARVPGDAGLAAPVAQASGDVPLTPGRNPARGSCVSLVEWGPVGRRRPNPWVTVDALAVLRAAAGEVP